VKNILYRLDLKGSPYLYIAPFFVLFGVFGLFPLAYTAWVSLNKWQLISDTHTFIGLANYRHLFTDAYFWNALRNTCQIWVLSTIPQLIAALFLAHVLNQRLRSATFWRITALLPNMTSVAAVALIFGQIFGRDYGLVNFVLGLFGAGHVDWQSGTATSQIAISAMIIWRWTGYNSLIYLAAMQAVPKDLYDASALDGASGLQQLRKITIPAIRPTIVLTVIISTIGGLQVLAEPLLFGGASLTGGSDRQFQTLSLYLYEVAFGRYDFGYAATAAYAMFGVIVIAAALNYFLVTRLRRS
jgi:cellobiose transport system permease protein